MDLVDICNDGDRHQWRGYSEDGMTCDGCGVSEAELDQMRRTAKRRARPSERATLVNRAADDLDRLEELEPRTGRVGDANELRRLAKSWRLRSDFDVVPREE